MTRSPRRWPGTGPRPGVPLRNCQPGCARPRPPSACFGYAEAARHWQRAIELCALVPDAEQLLPASICPTCTSAGVDALYAAGEPADGTGRGGVPPLRRPSRPGHRRIDTPARSPGLDGARIPRPASRAVRAGAAPVRAAATLSRPSQGLVGTYGLFLFFGRGPGDARRAAFTRALEVAEAVGAPGVAAFIQMNLAHEACLRGQVAEGLATGRNERGR